jgi:hypothetical protein
MPLQMGKYDEFSRLSQPQTDRQNEASVINPSKASPQFRIKWNC